MVATLLLPCGQELVVSHLLKQGVDVDVTILVRALKIRLLCSSLSLATCSTFSELFESIVNNRDDDQSKKAVGVHRQRDRGKECTGGLQVLQSLLREVCVPRRRVWQGEVAKDGFLLAERDFFD